MRLLHYTYDIADFLSGTGSKVMVEEYTYIMSRIRFLADQHYEQRCGSHLYDEIRNRYPIDFQEGDFSLEDNLVETCSLLMLNMIAGTCGDPLPNVRAEAAILRYLKAGKPTLLLHGSSAAFWMWDWWRPQVGFRWVRGNCPSGLPPSTHPVRPFHLAKSKTSHPLLANLQEMDVPKDEIYIHLEQTRPTLTLMETTTDEGTFPQAYLTTSDWGGTIAGYIPGHRPDVVRAPAMVSNVCAIIDFLLKENPVRGA